MKLDQYLAANGISDPAFAEIIGTSTEAVRRYRKGTRRPTDEIMPKIFAATAGRVDANAFFGLPSYGDCCTSGNDSATHGGNKPSGRRGGRGSRAA